MHSGTDYEPMLKLKCTKCEQKFYWGAVYGGVSCLTKCPSCKAETIRDTEVFEILSRIHEGTKE